MSTNKSSILIKVNNPFHRNYSRTSYYIKIGFTIKGEKIEVPAKVDTGATYTIIGTEIAGFLQFKDEIMHNYIAKGKAYDASDNDLDIYAYKVSNFKLSDDIIFPEVLINFSEKLGKKAVVGMDILSLFNFSYIKDPIGSNGHFEVFNYNEVLEKLYSSKVYNDLGYIRPDMVLLLDDAPQSSKEKSQLSTKKGKYTKEDIEANYMNKRIKEEKSRQ